VSMFIPNKKARPGQGRATARGTTLVPTASAR
jgi:hypothetical protein